MQEARHSALAHSFKEDGFAIARGFFSQETVAEICRRAEKILDQRTEFSPTYTNITKGLEKVDGFFAQLLNAGPQVSLLQELLGTRPIPATASQEQHRRRSLSAHRFGHGNIGSTIPIDITAASIFLELASAAESYLKPNQANDLIIPT